MPRAPRLELEVHTPRPAFDLQALSAASRKFELLDLRLRRGSFERGGDVAAPAGVIKVEMHPTVLLPVEGALVASVEARVRALRSSEAPAGRRDGEPLFTAEAAYEILYAVNKQDAPTEAETNAFIDLNPGFNCWPYLREFVEGASAKLGMRRITLPLFRIGDAKCVQKQSGITKRAAAAKK